MLPYKKVLYLAQQVFGHSLFLYLKYICYLYFYLIPYLKYILGIEVKLFKLIIFLKFEKSFFFTILGNKTFKSNYLFDVSFLR